MAKEQKFTLQEMLECWEVAQDSWAQECGADMSDFDEEDDYEVPINKKEWFKQRFGIDVPSD